VNRATDQVVDFVLEIDRMLHVRIGA